MVQLSRVVRIRGSELEKAKERCGVVCTGAVSVRISCFQRCGMACRSWCSSEVVRVKERCVSGHWKKWQISKLEM